MLIFNLFQFFLMLLNLHHIDRSPQISNLAQLPLAFFQAGDLNLVMKLFLHLLEERPTLFLHKFDTFLNCLLSAL